MRNHRLFLPCITETCWSLEMNCSAIVILEDATHQEHFIKQLRAKAAQRFASGESRAFGNCLALPHVAGKDKTGSGEERSTQKQKTKTKKQKKKKKKKDVVQGLAV